ncbi:hypothetical protein [Bacillus paramycoides]|uniref:hypothetical protein n=1 Tax=Bacillus paramycoides TaxID=2026194 RepID=UPI002E1EBAB6|nr:hypothetical protein [Bacillus paramycoides]
MEDFLSLLRTSLDTEGRKVTIKNLTIPALYYYEELYGLISTDSEEEGIDDFIWLKFNKETFDEYFDEMKYEEIISILKKEDGVYVSYDGAFIKDITIEGISKEFTINVQGEILNVIGVDIREINSTSTYDLNRGIFGFESQDGENLYLLSEKMKKRITEALEPYINEPCFAYLRRQLIGQFSKNEKQELLLIKCQNCNEHDIYHIVEVINEVCNPEYCRNCVKQKFSSISKVPFGMPFLINLYGYFNILNQDYLHKGIQPDGDLLDKLMPYITSEHPLEMGVVFDYVRNNVKKNFEKDSYELLKIFDGIIEEAKQINAEEYKKLITSLEKLSSLQSLQSTIDMVDVFKDIEEKSKDSFIKLFYPHPLIKEDSTHIYSDKEVVHKSLTNIANLYKDIFDLVSDHKFISNLGRILKGQNVDEDCVSEELFGLQLLKKTRKYVKDTKLQVIIKDSYDSKIRNSIAHPGRYIDRQNNEVKIFNKGNLTATMTIDEFLAKVERLISFHRELVGLKYRAAMEADRDFLSTGGIVSFEVDFFTKGEDIERPYVIINQLYPFKKFSPNIDWWRDVICINPVIDGEENGLSISIKRQPSILGKSPLVNENIYGISPHLREWIEMLIKQKEFVVAHRYIHIPVDISEREEPFSWIPISVPVYSLNKEEEYFIQNMSESGKVKISDDLIGQLRDLIK